jgi:hypothetical protein
MVARTHAAIYLSQNATGLTVYDQWKKHPAQKRVIRFKRGSGKLVNDGAGFYTIEDSRPAK